jgi:argininosuccinate lyase
VEDYTASIRFDRRLYRHDIRGSIAHATMLGEVGIIPKAEAEKIVRGLGEILAEMDRGAFVEDPALEDIHLHVERRLIDKIGEIGGKLHTARSRNDQVALDLRLYLREEIDKIVGRLADLRRATLDFAEAHLDTILPGYTHLQAAQPIRLAHHLLAYDAMLARDAARLRDCRRRVDVLPLGAGALAGTTFPIDRARVAELLGFPRLAENSLDAVSDRDFVAEFLAGAALIMVHLSRWSEELILWSSAEFGFIEIGDAFTTGSSIMPQKKNPDVAEICRGKTGRVVGDLVGLLTTLKGLPLAYNRDLQEDKEALFDAVDSVRASLAVFAAMLPTIRASRERMRAATERGFLEATDAADYLAARGLPFRQAHEVVGELVRHCIAKGARLPDLPLEEFRRFSPLFGPDIHGHLAIEACVERRATPGGTARTRVIEALGAARARLEAE